MKPTYPFWFSPICSETDCLANFVGRTFVIAHRESTDLLEKTLMTEGLACEVLRQEPITENIEYSRSYLCMMNHRRAWQKTVEQTSPSLIVEADFVPVVGIGQLSIPFPSQEENLGIAWLYTCGPQVYHVSQQGHASGYSTAMVAYIITPHSAKCLIDLSDQIIDKYGVTQYSTWDSEVEEFLRSRKLKNYLPFRNYGEHGGIPNPEHKQNGLSATHRADVLFGKLAFMPDYARQSSIPWLAFNWERTQGRLKGLARLVAGKFLRLKVLRQSSTPQRMLGFALGRQLSPFL